MFLEKFEERNLTFPFNTVGKDIFSRFLNELKSGKVIVPEKRSNTNPDSLSCKSCSSFCNTSCATSKSSCGPTSPPYFFHGLFHLFADADVVDDKATLFCAEFTVYTRNSLNKRMFR